MPRSVSCWVSITFAPPPASSPSPKLVDGKFPDYERVLPRGGDKLVVGDRQLLREAFSRTAILSNESTAAFACSWKAAC